MGQVSLCALMLKNIQIYELGGGGHSASLSVGLGNVGCELSLSFAFWNAVLLSRLPLSTSANAWCICIRASKHEMV